MKCIWPGCRSHAPEGKHYCYLHGRHAPKDAKSGPKPIPKKSEKRKQEDKKLKKLFNGRETNTCQLQIPNVCTGTVQGFDHTQKTSPNNRLQPDNMKLSCNACNTYKETSEGQEWAKENGHHVSRFAKVDLGASFSKFIKTVLT